METIFMNTLSSKTNEPHKFLNHTNHKKKKRKKLICLINAEKYKKTLQKR